MKFHRNSALFPGDLPQPRFDAIQSSSIAYLSARFELAGIGWKDHEGPAADKTGGKKRTQPTRPDLIPHCNFEDEHDDKDDLVADFGASSAERYAAL
jgi:hypothetical protein